eukprot:6179420-Pleurochrysis_carterae.AAC.4
MDLAGLVHANNVGPVRGQVVWECHGQQVIAPVVCRLHAPPPNDSSAMRGETTDQIFSLMVTGNEFLLPVTK